MKGAKSADLQNYPSSKKKSDFQSKKKKKKKKGNYKSKI